MFSKNSPYFNFFLMIAVGYTLLVTITGNSTPTSSRPPVFRKPKVIQYPVIPNEDRPLRLSITVNHPSFLRVNVGDIVKAGDILADNSQERSRLSVQKKTILLQIARLKNKQIIPPPPFPKLPPLQPLPAADYSQENAAISQAKLRLQQAKSILASRSPWLKRPNDLAYQDALSQVVRQAKMIYAMTNRHMSPEIIQHESAVLKQLEKEVHKSKVELDLSIAKQLQELQQLQINLQLALSDLEQKQAALSAAYSHRKLLLFQADTEARKQMQQQQQMSLEFSHQMTLYQQQLRDKDFHLAELTIRGNAS